MRYSAVIAGLFAVTALASPINKREIVYDVVDVVTITEVVTAGAHAPTPAPAAPVPAAKPAAPAPKPAAAAPKPAAPAPAAAAKPAAVASVISTIAAASQTAAPASGLNAALKVYDPECQTGDDVFVNSVLAHHNIHRANHSADALTYDADLAKYAQAKAETCVFDETPAPGFSGSAGMNIAQGTYLSAANISNTVTDLWYNNEVQPYASGAGWGNTNPNVNLPGSTFQYWGHLSQVVWKGSKTVGCGVSACGPGSSIKSGYFVACLYSPPGNYIGDFQNVGVPLNQPYVGPAYN